MPSGRNACAEVIASEGQYHFSPAAREALVDYIVRRRAQPNFANARSIRNAFDRSRLRQAMRLFDGSGAVDRDALMTIEAADIKGSRVFTS